MKSSRHHRDMGTLPAELAFRRSRKPVDIATGAAQALAPIDGATAVTSDRKEVKRGQ